MIQHFKLWLCIGLLPAGALAGSSNDFFSSFDLQVKGEYVSLTHEDINADNLQDIALFTYKKAPSGTKRRWLSIYLQTPSGFTGEPDQQIQIADDLILFDFGDISGDSQKELVFFSDSGIKYYSFKNGLFVISDQLLSTRESIFMLSDRTTLRRWDFIRDLNGDGRDDIYIQHIRTATLLLRTSDGGWHENKIELSTKSRLFSYYNKRFSVGHKSNALYSTPYLLLLDYNLDGEDDLVGIYKDSLVAFVKNEKGHFEKPNFNKIALDYGEIWGGAKIQRTHLDDKSERKSLYRLRDLNNDGIFDIVGTMISTKKSLINPRSEVLIYFGQKNTNAAGPPVIFPTEPNQKLVTDGTMMVLDLIDINKDQRIDLVIPTVSIGITQIMKMLLTKTVNLEAGYYLMRPDHRFDAKAEQVRRMSVKFSFKGGAASPVYELADFNADGLYDILSSTNEQQLTIHFGNLKDLVSEQVQKRIAMPLPQDGTLVRTARLNNNGMQDVIITYNEDDLENKNIDNIVKILLR